MNTWLFALIIAAIVGWNVLTWPVRRRGGGQACAGPGLDGIGQVLLAPPLALLAGLVALAVGTWIYTPSGLTTAILAVVGAVAPRVARLRRR